MSRKLIPGFTYTPTRREAEWTREEWQKRIAAALADGGFRRVEHGETFIHGADGLIQAEIYANVSARKEERDG